MVDTSREGIIKILMTRDGMTRQDAEELYNITNEEIQDAIDRGADLFELEDIIQGNFGLEPDYLEDFLM